MYISDQIRAESEENKGTKITIIIDEKIKEEGYNEIIEKGNYLKKEKVGIVGKAKSLLISSICDTLSSQIGQYGNTKIIILNVPLANS